MTSDTPKNPEELPAVRGSSLSDILGQYVLGVAIKRVCDGEAHLRPGSLLLLMMSDGTMAVIDNTDDSIATTGGLRNGGWEGAMGYMQDTMRVVHQCRLDESREERKVLCDSEDYL
ncbi:MAG TPA: hypothetical protein VGH91_12145 [Gammaproteobacteria bacterium]|jgi:hypothetical protein